MPKSNAKFLAFKPSGKWYATGDGWLSLEVFKVWSTQERRNQIVKDNGGKYPGLNGPGEHFVFVVLPSDDIEHGYPLMLNILP